MNPVEKRMRYDSAMAYVRAAYEQINIVFSGTNKVLHLKVALAALQCAAEDLTPLEEFLEIPVEQLETEVLGIIEGSRKNRAAMLGVAQAEAAAVPAGVESDPPIEPVADDERPRAAIFDMKTGRRIG